MVGLATDECLELAFARLGAVVANTCEQACIVSVIPNECGRGLGGVWMHPHTMHISL